MNGYIWVYSFNERLNDTGIVKIRRVCIFFIYYNLKKIYKNTYFSVCTKQIVTTSHKAFNYHTFGAGDSFKQQHFRLLCAETVFFITAKYLLTTESINFSYFFVTSLAKPQTYKTLFYYEFSSDMNKSQAPLDKCWPNNTRLSQQLSLYVVEIICTQVCCAYKRLH